MFAYINIWRRTTPFFRIRAAHVVSGIVVHAMKNAALGSCSRFKHRRLRASPDDCTP